MKKIVYFENQKVHYDFIYNALCEEYDVYPKPEEFKKLCRMSLAFLYDMEKNLRPLVSYLRSVKADLYIVDVALATDMESAQDDFTGGEIRKNLLSNLFPKTTAIFLTGHYRADLEPYAQEGDDFLSKFDNSHYPHEVSLKQLKILIEKHLQK
ncbi:hypothetical protein IM793_06250 [Pedobacter sp. MR2016-19]|uniref:hypothetical protein n=1 Tax=Pedobacter sp. MR2016-19 TaxID=2780089 RepID=UPI0018756064|nr:hypothetical protein [Pedobacter sp. MR2016-19]MBE5318746.1 hypothetical protein [Pedobacter sp. MR2016-19]